MQRRFTVPAAATLLLTVGLTAGPASASNLVHCPGQSLQAKVNTAAPGATLSITGTCHVDLVVKKDLTLEGAPAAALDGDDAGSTITITGSPTVHLVDLTVTGGRSPEGAGIDAAGGTLTLLHVTVEDNLAEGSSAQGGGIFSGGTLKVTQSTIAHNRAAATGNGVPANGDGGGIELQGQQLTVTSSTIASNHATADATGAGASSVGGGILVVTGGLTVTASHFTGNHVESSNDVNQFMQALGGAVADAATGGTATIAGSTFDQDAATSEGSGTGSGLSLGGSVFLSLTNATISNSTFTGSRATSSSVNESAETDGGAISATVASKITLSSVRVLGSTASATGVRSEQAMGGGLDLHGTASITASSITGGIADAEGGTNQTLSVGAGIFADSTGTKLTVTRSTIAGNHSLARAPADQPNAFGAGIASEAPTSITASTVSGNVATAIEPNHVTSLDAAAEAGGMYLTQGANTITNSTIVGNVAKATAPGSGSAAALGGGILGSGSLTSLTIVAGTVARNVVEGSAGTLSASGGGLYAAVGPFTLHGTILALNTAPTSADGPNCGGQVAIGSAGHNLLGTTAGCTFNKQSSDLVNKPPGLAALANNGGPTQTIALTNTSLARNAFAPPCPTATDQRGVHRPQGTRCDIGAFERS
ncbi:MAG: choice-of-anchor Q domain-containing protein [Actinomycetota bacterium]